MAPKSIFRIFLSVVFLYFAGMAFQQQTLLLITKPLLITSLLWFFLVATKTNYSAIKWYAAAALFFSTAGDSLLMFAFRTELFFLAGLVAFLIAHAFYILCFHHIKTREDVPGKWQWAIVVTIYYAFIMSLLLPNTGSMKLPVILYGLVISFMLFVAALLYDLPDNKTARYILSGALLFVVSDSLLAINKFHHKFEQAGWMVMATYLAAQVLLAQGIIRYIASANQKKDPAN